MSEMTVKLQQFDRHLAAAGRSPNTRAAYGRDVRQYLQYAAQHQQPPAAATTIEAWLAALKDDQQLANTTIARKIAAVRAYFTHTTGGAPNPAAGLTTPKSEQHLPTYLIPAEVQRLLHAPAAQTWLGRRDRAILALLARAGLRVAEVTTLQWADVNYRDRELRVYGKGRKERVVPLFEEAHDALARWEARARRAYTTIFVTYRDKQPLSPRAVQKLVSKYAAAAELEVHVTPHTLRRTAATLWKEAGIPLRDIQHFLGHASLVTTERYVAVTPHAVQHAVGTWEVYRRSGYRGSRW